jgi:hypothetical protein
MKYWKTIPDDFTSHGHKWKMNKWYKVDGEIKCCSNGFHCSPTIMDAIGYVTPGWICLVEVRGDHQDQGDKSAWREMRILKRWKLTEKQLRQIAIFAAELALPIFEKEHPDDKRPRNAIETAKRYLRGKATLEELAAARAAAMAAAGAAAWAAARAAARAAAMDAAGAAARAAAMDAAWAAAWAAAMDAAGDAITKTIERKIKSMLK